MDEPRGQPPTSPSTNHGQGRAAGGRRIPGRPRPPPPRGAARSPGRPLLDALRHLPDSGNPVGRRMFPGLACPPGSAGGWRLAVPPEGCLAHGPPGRIPERGLEGPPAIWPGEVNSAAGGAVLLGQPGPVSSPAACAARRLRRGELTELLAVPLVPGGPLVPSRVPTPRRCPAWTSTHQAASLVRQGSSCGRWNLRGLAETGAAGPGRDLRHQVDPVARGGARPSTGPVPSARAGGKSSRSGGSPRASVNCWRSFTQAGHLRAEGRGAGGRGRTGTSSMASSRSAAVEYCIDSRFCSWRSPLSAHEAARRA